MPDHAKIKGLYFNNYVNTWPYRANILIFINFKRISISGQLLAWHRSAGAEIMTLESNKYTDISSDFDNEELMESRHFDIAISDLRFKNPALLDATRAVMVGGKRLTEAARDFDVTQPTITNSIKRVRKSFEAWCAANKLTVCTHVLHEDDRELIDRLEKRTIAPLILDANAAKPSPRKSRSKPVAKTAAKIRTKN